ncbi:MAG TPA: biopolymer transporter ExbD [Steroidobacteraceae bacterium]|nr:biopolymer transporter ExbD [Steroidobacteraceae bacterium]
MSLARNTRKLMRRHRRPSELLLVPMIDIFTVLVTFLLMTAVFSRTVILELKLPPPSNQPIDLPKDLNLEVIVHKDDLVIADRGTGPLRTLPNIATGYDLQGLTDFLHYVKSRYQSKTEASILLEPTTPYDTMVQIMDRLRVEQISAGLQTVQYELFPDISIGDAPVTEGAAP